MNSSLITVRDDRLAYGNSIGKRMFDICGALVLLMCAAPLMLLIAFFIKLEDREGPVIYKQERVGKDGALFVFYKFRSMWWKDSITPENPQLIKALCREEELVKNCNARRGQVKIPNDPRRTKVGRWLERWVLDELPQFLNVLKGDMSLVGPRPSIVDRIQSRWDDYLSIYVVRPGVTGLAQITNLATISAEEEIALDRQYLDRMSLGYDIQICLRTPLAILKRKGRY